MPRWRVAKLLELPPRRTRFRGPAARRLLREAAARRRREPRDATFAVDAGERADRPVAAGLEARRAARGGAILAAATAGDRVAQLAIAETQPKRTTAQARAMGITGTVGSYETFYGGDPNRIHNVQLVAHLVDNKLIAPGATFSFNGDDRRA